MPIFRNGGSYGEQVRNVASTSVQSIGSAVVTITPLPDQKYIRIKPIHIGSYYYGFSSSVSPSNAEFFNSGITILTNTPVYLVGVGSASVSAVSSAGLVTEASDTINITSHGLTDGTQVSYSSTGSAIGGLTSGNKYFVVSSATNSFKLSLTSGGSAINLTDDGTGTHTFNTMRDVYIEQGV